jgi:hypothetical protein
VLCYDPKGLGMALNRQKIKGKDLKEKAQAFIALQEEGSDRTLPVLPAPRKVKLSAVVDEMEDA